MNGTTLIREKPVNPYSRSGMQERVRAGSPPTAGRTLKASARRRNRVSPPILTRAESRRARAPSTASVTTRTTERLGRPG